MAGMGQGNHGGLQILGGDVEEEAIRSSERHPGGMPCATALKYEMGKMS